MSARCPAPLDLAVLVDYWFDELPSGDQDRIEQHLFECGWCADLLGSLVALGDGVRQLASEGAFRVVVSPSFVETASRRGLRVREYSVAPGGSVACTVTAEDDLVIARLRGEFRGISRLDVVTVTENQPEHRIEDVPFAAGSSELIVAEHTEALRAQPTSIMRLRLVAAEPTGDRLVGEYTFNHTHSGS
jgi:Putative zinc-finger